MKAGLKKYTLSKNTGMVSFERFDLPEELTTFSTSLKFRFFSDMDEVRSVAKKSSVTLHEITGERGLIGAIAALGMYDYPEFAAKLPTLCR